MPSTVIKYLHELGENLSIARKRRREPLKVWAQRIGVSEPMLKRMENGDPSVSMGVYSSALVCQLKNTAVGAVDDARPDRWGERVMLVMIGLGHWGFQFHLKSIFAEVWVVPDLKP